MQLKGAGYVHSVRGAGGGYILSVDPQDVNLLDVVQLVDGPNALGTVENLHHKGTSWQILRNVWQEVNSHEESILRETTFARLVDLSNQHSANMYYI